MGNSEKNKQAANGAGPSGSTSSGEFSFNPLINHNIASHPFVGSTHHPFHINQMTRDGSCNPIPLSGSVNAATGTASSSRRGGILLPHPFMSPQGRRILPSSPCSRGRGRSSSSSPSTSLQGRINSSPIPCKRAYATRPVVVRQGNDELKLIENITDILGPAQVRYLLFQGLWDEHIAQHLLNPNIGRNGGLKLIENIADTLSPDEVRHLLFEGHSDGYITRPLLHPNIGSNVRYSSSCPPKFSDSTRVYTEKQ